MSRRDSPMPAAWAEAGVPAGALAAFAGGLCPVHRTPLWPDMVSAGGKGGLPRRWFAAGRCDACAADWHQGTVAGGTVLIVTWDTGPVTPDPARAAPPPE